MANYGGIAALADALSRFKQNQKARQSAVQGYISGDFFVVGEKAYPYEAVCDCDTADGQYVWGSITDNGTAVIVGA